MRPGTLLPCSTPTGTETDYAIDPVADTQTTTNKLTSSSAVLSSSAYQLDGDGRKTSVETAAGDACRENRTRSRDSHGREYSPMPPRHLRF